VKRGGHDHEKKRRCSWKMRVWGLKTSQGKKNDPRHMGGGTRPHEKKRTYVGPSKWGENFNRLTKSTHENLCSEEKNRNFKTRRNKTNDWPTRTTPLGSPKAEIQNEGWTSRRPERPVEKNNLVKAKWTIKGKGRTGNETQLQTRNKEKKSDTHPKTAESRYHFWWAGERKGKWVKKNFVGGKSPATTETGGGKQHNR